MAIQIFQRLETKYRLDESQLHALLPRLLEHMDPDVHCTNGREYSIYSMYYDTPDNQIIRRSIAKPYYKEKLRMRSYTVPSCEEDTVFLELKKKIGGIVNKRRIVAPLGEVRRFLDNGIRPQAKSALQKQVIDEIAFFLSKYDVHPTVAISYDRMAFFGKDDPGLRVTFDHNIRTRRTGLRMENGGAGNLLIPADEWLMEIKIFGAIPLWLAGVLSELHIYKTSFSKYGFEYQQYCMLGASTGGLAESIRQAQNADHQGMTSPLHWAI